ncbi:MAG: NAD(P)H-quinone oxidoreductase [Proteobacteria bacterium]|nr:NAD(P)H-quinone oxidoreductase [Pseudomonadota bacterium]
MQYIKLEKTGSAKNLSVEEGKSPLPGENEVLVKVVAAGINRPDIMQRQGLYPPPKGASPVLGLEVSGEVLETGNNVSRWKVGDRVCALTNGGGYSEQITLPEGQCLSIPKGLSMVEAAAIPETFFTVWTNVFDRVGLQAGESFLVHGGSSGIGTAAIQMAKAMGSRVFTTTGSEAKCQVCVELGAELAINYQNEDFLERLLAVTEGKGIDVILDMIGGKYVQKNISLAATEGRIVNINYMQGASVEVNLMPIMIKRLTLTGSTLRPQSAQAKKGIAEKLEQYIWPLIEQGKIKPLIARVFPFAEVIHAHELMESNQHIGKIVLSLE